MLSIFLKFNNISYSNILISILFLMVVFIILKLLDKKYKSKIHQYNREELLDIPVSILSYFDLSKINNNSYMLTFLDLIAKKYYKINKVNNNYLISWNKGNLYEYDETNLYNHEIEVIKTINVIIDESKTKEITIEELKKGLEYYFNFTNTINDYYSKLKGEIKNNFGLISFSQNYFWATLIILMYEITNFDFNVFSLLFTGLVLVISMLMKNFEFKLNKIIGVILIIYILLILFFPLFSFLTPDLNTLLLFLIMFNPILLFVSIIILQKKYYDKSQMDLYNKIYGLKKFLREFGRFHEKETGYVKLYERYYVFSVAFNIKLEKNLYKDLIFDDKDFNTLTAYEFAEFMFSLSYDFFNIEK